jgi:hypothetical protein
MPFYEATFGDETCYVLVESRPTERGAVFVATPYVLDTEILYWFPNGEGRAIEVPGASEDRRALDRGEISDGSVRFTDCSISAGRVAKVCASTGSAHTSQIASLLSRMRSGAITAQKLLSSRLPSPVVCRV